MLHLKMIQSKFVYMTEWLEILTIAPATPQFNNNLCAFYDDFFAQSRDIDSSPHQPDRFLAHCEMIYRHKNIS